MANEEDKPETDAPLNETEMRRVREIVARQLRGLAKAIELGQCNFVSITWDADDPLEMVGNAALDMKSYALYDAEYEQARMFQKMVKETAAKVKKSPAGKNAANPFGDFMEDITDRLSASKAQAEAEGPCENPDCIACHGVKPGEN